MFGGKYLQEKKRKFVYIVIKEIRQSVLGTDFCLLYFFMHGFKLHIEHKNNFGGKCNNNNKKSELQTNKSWTGIYTKHKYFIILVKDFYHLWNFLFLILFIWSFHFFLVLIFWIWKCCLFVGTYMAESVKNDRMNDFFYYSSIWYDFWLMLRVFLGEYFCAS